jgi:hypothetical protein
MDEIKYGTFDLYENDTLVGTIYRVNNFQFEKYDDAELIARIEYKTDSTYLMNGIEKNPTGIDTIIWLTTYKRISDKKFKIMAKPYNSDIDYQYDAILLKVDTNVPEVYIKKLNKLGKE